MKTNKAVYPKPKIIDERRIYQERLIPMFDPKIEEAYLKEMRKLICVSLIPYLGTTKENMETNDCVNSHIHLT